VKARGSCAGLLAAAAAAAGAAAPAHGRGGGPGRGRPPDAVRGAGRFEISTNGVSTNDPCRNAFLHRVDTHLSIGFCFCGNTGWGLRYLSAPQAGALLGARTTRWEAANSMIF
jgi:hypothetical protein